MIRVVIVDDQALVRQGFAGLLGVAGMEVVGEAADGKAAREVIVRTRPDVVLLDMRMPRFDGIWVLQQLREEDIDVPVLVLTTFDEDALVLDALRSGARGYLLKDITLEQLTHAVETLAAGGTLIAPALTDRMLRAIRSQAPPEDATAIDGARELTDRELDVLRLVASGYSNRQIGDALFLAEGTVKNHVSTILVKLGARDRTNAVLRALHDGLLG
ncbi:response regulator transcription factor [Microbacterium esteraromaticum]|uniref:Response regulator transcription factor n=1 Tax=Microbacterium esteraromaticum TaxID=57043 RepID=A0A7D8ALH5_9MICO|nr:response regulator transcription factor [Microbacterium esteraromaticum]QMU97128.1 response regulator transcription factor [Microbacterium esteraromaticum]